MTPFIDYAYCIVPADLDISTVPRGIGESVVRAVPEGSVAALVSSLDGDEYDPSAVEALAGDPAWLAPRASRHDAVLNAVSDVAPLLPLPMWVLFRDDGAVHAMLHARQAELNAALESVRGAREYGVRVVADARALEEAARALDPELREAALRIPLASPGEGYLLKRKLAERSRTAVREVAAQIATRVNADLSSASRSAAQRPLDPAQAPGVILDASYLVDVARYDEFRAVLTARVEELGCYGCRFEFTGPWPPYHFVSGR